MAKIIILGDLHFGARNSNQIIEHWQRKFFEECFWPYVKLNGIKQIIQLGDWWDNRKWININTIAFQKEVFVKPSIEHNVQVDAIIGNHDIPYRHSLENNSPQLMLSQYENINIHDEPSILEIEDVTFDLIPWMCRENYDECLEIIKEGGDICVGHFDIQGFVMHPGAVSVEGLKSSDFKNWNTVWSGHYHTQSKNENIHYLGTPYQMSWSDHTTKHGFWVFDTADRSMQFIENPFRYFYKFVWDDGCNTGPLDYLEKSYVKVNVKNKPDFESFEKFVDKLNFNSPHELKIVESFEEFNEQNVSDLINVSTTEDLIQEYVDDVATTASKENVKAMMLSIYQEALTVDD